MRILGRLKKYQIFWNIAAKLAAFYPRRMFKKLPLEIVLEPTNTCNLRCPVCPTHFAMKRKKGFMDFDLFKSVIDEFTDKRTKPRILLSFAGEPILHRDIAKMVDYAHKNGHSTYISTNATTLNRKLSADLIKNGLDSIHLCLDGITKESHEAYRVGSDFETAKKNIEKFISLKRELENNKPEITIQTLLTSFSEKETDRLTAWAKNIGADAINLKSLSMGSYTTAEMKEKYSYLLPSEKYRRKISKLKKTVCAVPLRQALIYWDGRLGLCCDDFDAEINFPYIQEKGFIKTLISDESVKKRKMAFRKKFALCQRCSLGNSDFYGMNIKFRSQFHEK